MTEYTWKNLVAFPVWECKICGAISSRDGICDHLNNKHNIHSIELFNDRAYSPNFEYPNVISPKGQSDKISKT